MIDVGVITVPIGGAVGHLRATVRVTGERRWRARWWLAVWLFHLAARVAGCHLVLDLSADGPAVADGADT